MAEVQRFLRSRHPQHRVYNLCKEDDRRRPEDEKLAVSMLEIFVNKKVGGLLFFFLDDGFG